MVKSPPIEDGIALERSGRANELRSLWLRLGDTEDRRQLEKLWPAMCGRWIIGDFGSASPKKQA